MKGLLLSVGGLVAAFSLAVGLGSALAANHTASRGATVAVSNSALGPILVDGRGRTLYLFEKDRAGKSTCSGKCAAFWPPLIASGKPHAAGGASASMLGTTKRADGRLQVTYDHHPLYTFVKDTGKGQTYGEGIDAFGAEWYVVSPRGAKVDKNVATGTGGGDYPAPPPHYGKGY